MSPKYSPPPPPPSFPSRLRSSVVSASLLNASEEEKVQVLHIKLDIKFDILNECTDIKQTKNVILKIKCQRQFFFFLFCYSFFSLSVLIECQKYFEIQTSNSFS